MQFLQYLKNSNACRLKKRYKARLKKPFWLASKLSRVEFRYADGGEQGQFYNCFLSSSKWYYINIEFSISTNVQQKFCFFFHYEILPKILTISHTETIFLPNSALWCHGSIIYRSFFRYRALLDFLEIFLFAFLYSTKEKHSQVAN